MNTAAFYSLYVIIIQILEMHESQKKALVMELAQGIIVMLYQGIVYYSLRAGYCRYNRSYLSIAAVKRVDREK